MNQIPQREAVPRGTGSRTLNGTLRIVIAGGAGFLAYFVMRLITPIPSRHSVLESPIDLKEPGIFGLAYRVQHIINSPYVILPVFAVWTYLAISKRNETSSWIPAFLVGVTVPMILRWIL